jgi:hypothetical protein
VKGGGRSGKKKRTLHAHRAPSALLPSVHARSFAAMSGRLIWHHFWQITTTTTHNQKVHIAVGDDPTAMHVTWRTLGAECVLFLLHADFLPGDGWAAEGGCV